MATTSQAQVDEYVQFQLDQDAARCMRELAVALAKFYGLDRRCTNCEHWNDPAGPRPGCALAGGQMPPPRVIANGCPEWTEEVIPF